MVNCSMDGLSMDAHTHTHTHFEYMCVSHVFDNYEDLKLLNE